MKAGVGVGVANEKTTHTRFMLVGEKANGMCVPARMIAATIIVAGVYPKTTINQNSHPISNIIAVANPSHHNKSVATFFFFCPTAIRIDKMPTLDFCTAAPPHCIVGGILGRAFVA
mmetsp:Transcript_24823/g.69703  ORF Transcript_24823/g.69703 Transcript_24823/m.69703 type:complete len:116 (-) Transcript_24823:512-859(-)